MKLVITVDVGASLTKIIYRFWKSSKNSQTGYVCMSPLMEKITADKLKDYLDFIGWVGMPQPEDEAYLKIGDDYFVVGNLAKEFDAEDRTFERKYENALFKVLAAIGVVLTKNKVKNEEQIQIWVSVLLPWAEYNDRPIFVNQLLKYLGNFEFRGQPVKVKATKENIIVMPEGGGIATAYCLKKGALYLKGKTIGIAMFGHQNITGLVIKNGKLIRGDSPKIGLTWFLDHVIQSTSGLDREKLLKAINQCWADLKLDITTPYVIGCSRENSLGQKYKLGRTSRPQYNRSYQAITDLATARNQELRNLEIDSIERAIAKAEDDYFEKVKKWLRKMFPLKETDYLLFSGGAVRFIKQVLEDYCNCYRPVDYWGKYHNSKYRFIKINGVNEYLGFSDPYIELVSDFELAKVVKELLKLSLRDIEELLDIRFADNHGIFEYTLEIEKKQKLQTLRTAAR